MKRFIQELINLDTNELLRADDLLSEDTYFNHAIRRVLKEKQRGIQNTDREDLNIGCATCMQPVILCGTKEGEYYFKHGTDSGDCPYKSTEKYSHKEIERMKYNGAKESQLHRELKTSIAESLNLQNSDCTNIQIEKRITAGLSKKWRQPDVSAEYKEYNIAFEIQLSTTFLDVIVEREHFYKNEKIFMLWVFKSFSEDGNRFTEKDIYCANNRNAFIINEETRILSHELGELVLLCKYQKPIYSNGNIQNEWHEDQVTLSQIIFNNETYKPYFFDYERELDLLKEQIKKNTFSYQFQKYWKDKFKLTKTARYSRDRELYSMLKGRKLIPSDEYHMQRFPEKLKSILDALYCLKEKDIYAYKYDSWLQVSNQVLEYHKEFSGIFLKALSTYGLLDDVLLADKRSSFRSKRERVKKGVKSDNPDYRQNLKYQRLFKYLFPELYNGVEA